MLRVYSSPLACRRLTSLLHNHQHTASARRRVLGACSIHRSLSFFCFFKREKKEVKPPPPHPPKPNDESKCIVQKPASMEDRYKACMVLAGVGDAIGFNNGKWEFTYAAAPIHEEFNKLGGLEKIDIKRMKISDDQTMHLATAEALTDNPKTLEELYNRLSACYVESFKDMMGRAPGPTTEYAVEQLSQGVPYNGILYSKQGGGCGGSMRAMCIGLRYPGEAQRDNLIAVSIESARMTHNHPTGFFGGLCSALFTAYAIEGVPVVEWGRKMVHEVLPKAYTYVEQQKRDWGDYQEDLKFFEVAWIKYLKERDIWENNKPKFPDNYGPGHRDYFYYTVSFKGWGGASGHDSVIIAYDALLGAENNFLELIKRGALHGGDNDTTGVIACAWWGALNGFEGVPRRIWEDVENRRLAETYGNSIYKLVHDVQLHPEKTTL